MVFYMYILYKIYLQWICWTLFFIARCSTIFTSELPEVPTHAIQIAPVYSKIV
jgi:hypothetical protein